MNLPLPSRDVIYRVIRDRSDQIQRGCERDCKCLLCTRSIMDKEEIKPGYHIAPIKKGTLGTVSKIQEELDELRDAEAQDVKIMIHVELADLYGALEAYADGMNLSMEDLKAMSDVTKRAFRNGRRK